MKLEKSRNISNQVKSRNVTLVKITEDSKEYRMALKVRKEYFFQGVEIDLESCIYDEFENDSCHFGLKSTRTDQLIGYLRINYLSSSVVLLSQLLLVEEERTIDNIRFFYRSVESYLREKGVELITASARLVYLPVYKLAGFKLIGERYKSVKTGIWHQRIQKKIKHFN
jgi:hypothetical protein